MKKINEGAEAIIYATELIGSKAILKRRIKKEYRIIQIDNEIRTSRSRNEARIIAMASKAGVKTPKLLLSDGFDIYMTCIDGERLDTYIKKARDTMIFASVGVMLGSLHSANIIHGDYTPANLIVKNNSVYIIDFGLAQITDSIEAKALDVLLMKRTLTRAFYKRFESAYLKKYSNAKDVIKRLAEIERRGRYQTRTLLVS